MATQSTSKLQKQADDIALDPDFHKGKTTFTFPNGDKYQGEYCAHRTGIVWREGYGTYTTKDGQVYKGFWIDDKLQGDEQLEIRYPNGSEYYGNLSENKYSGPAMYVLAPNMHLLTSFEDNKPSGDLLMMDAHGREWYGVAGEEEALLLPRHIFFDKIPSDLGRGRLRRPRLSSHETTKEATREERPQRRSDRDKMRQLELKIFAKTKKTVSDLKFEESEWYRSYIDFKRVYEEIIDKVKAQGEESLEPNQREWFGKYEEFKKRYREIIEKRKSGKERTLSECKLFELFEDEEYKNSCEPVPVFYASEMARGDAPSTGIDENSENRSKLTM